MPLTPLRDSSGVTPISSTPLSLAEASQATIAAPLTDVDKVSASQADKGAAGAALYGSGGASAALAGPSSKASVPPHPGMFATVEVAAPPAPGTLANAAAAKDPTVKRVFAEPSSRTSTTVRFEVSNPNGDELKPGERWLFEIPADLRGAAIRSVVLAHRKDDKYTSSVDANGRDAEGAYDLVTARNSETGQWVTWSDEYGSKKFAEPRSAGSPENENLHDWLAAVGKTPVDLVAVTAMGVGDRAIANVHFIEVEFFPPGQVESRQEEIFTPGTAFVDPDRGVNRPSYGGGQGAHFGASELAAKGLYPNAIKLGYGGSTSTVSESSYVGGGGRMHIKLPPGKVFGGLEVSIGDTVFDQSRPAEEQRNKDGHYGTLGWAKLGASLTHADGSGEAFLRNMNVPPSGVLSGGPVESGYVTKPGDEIVLEASSGAWVMGYRVQFMKTAAR
jgi:hypothetical protein